MTKDGTAEFVAVDARAAAIFDLIYPVGSIFATTGNALTRGTWEEIAKGRTLQGADSGHAAGTMIAAGLPNITGFFASYNGSLLGVYNYFSGSFYGDQIVKNYKDIDSLSNATTYEYSNQITLDASRSSSIYGNSTTVQPPAYVVHFYRRTA